VIYEKLRDNTEVQMDGIWSLCQLLLWRTCVVYGWF